MERMREIKLNILEEFLKNAPFDGWNISNLEKTSLKINSTTSYYKMFFEDPQAIASFFNEQINLQMIQKFNEIPKDKLTGISAKIQTLIEIRLNLLENHRKSMRSMNGLMAMPQNLLFSNKEVWKISDHMWHLAGDNSKDFNYYSKRGTLSIIYNSSFNFWLQNDSKDSHKALKDHIKKSIGKAMKIGKAKSKVKNFFKKIPFIRLINL